MSTIATLFVKLGLDKKDFDEGVGGMGSAIKSAAKIAAGAMVAVGAATAGVGALVTKAGFDINATLETSTLQFETLMGSADQAREHVKFLFEFAKKTPFETEPIIEASRMLQTFGGAALNTEGTLKLVGDAAAATGNQINEVGFWTGRAYSMIQGGKPFGEAAMRLQEMGILTPVARDEMERLQKTGASSAEVWGAMERNLGSFSGAMIKQAGTWQGITSTIADTLKIGAGKMTLPLFEAVKNMGAAFIGFTESPAWDRIISVGERAFGFLAGLINELTSAFTEGGITGALGEMGGGLGGIVRLIPGLGPLSLIFTTLVQLLPTVMPVLSAVADAFSQVMGAVQPLIPILGQALASVVAVLAPLITQLVGAIAPFLPLAAEIATQILSALFPAFTAIVDAIKPLLPLVVDLIKQLLPPLIGIVQALVPVIKLGVEVFVEIVKAVSPFLPLIMDLIKSLLPPLLSIVQALAPVVAELIPPVLSVVRAFLPLLPIVADLIRSLLPPLVSILGIIAPIISALAPVISLVAGLISGALTAALRVVVPILEILAGVIDGISQGIATVVGWIKKLAEKLEGIKLPDFLTRKSPSPLEQTLLGVAAGFKEINRIMPTVIGLGRLAVPNLSPILTPNFATPRLAIAGMESGLHPDKMSHRGRRGDTNITVHARTDADPFEIGAEVAWAQKIAG